MAEDDPPGEGPEGGQGAPEAPAGASVPALGKAAVA